MPDPIDELTRRTRRLQAERLRAEKPQAKVPPAIADLRELIATLAQLLTNPGPPDEPPVSVESGVAQTKDHRNED